MYVVLYFQMQGSVKLLVPLAGHFISELPATNIITAHFSSETGFKIQNVNTLLSDMFLSITSFCVLLKDMDVAKLA